MTKILHLPQVQIAGQLQDPNFTCATRDIGEKYAEHLGYDAYTRCTQGTNPPTSFHAANTAIVFICPSFSQLRPQPPFTPGAPMDVYCPIVRNNVFVGQSSPLIRYQSYDLVHQLVHLYLQDTALAADTTPPEVFDWNECVKLMAVPPPWSPSCRNPFNLVYYTAREYAISLSMGICVVAGCCADCADSG